jgi:hypothetical protein
MATTGAVTVDLNNFRDMINNSATVGERVTEGVSDQGSLIGLAIGLSIAIVLLFGVVFLMFGKIMQILKTTKALKSA